MPRNEVGCFLFWVNVVCCGTNLYSGLTPFNPFNFSIGMLNGFAAALLKDYAVPEEE